jgi:hypothetical protein
MLDDVALTDVAWIDERHLVAVAESTAEVADAIVLFDLEDPMRVLTVSASVLENAESLGEVTPVPGRAELVVSAGDGPRRLYRLRLPKAVGELFAAPPVPADTEPAPPREGLPTVVALDTNAFTGTALTHEGWADEIVVSPDGTHAAFVLSDSGLDERHPGDTEIAVVPLEGKGLRLLTRNDLRDGAPRFTADARAVVFSTRVTIPKTGTGIFAPRTAPVAP